MAPTEPYHPWVAALVRRAAPGPDGALLLDATALDAAIAEGSALAVEERSRRGQHLVLLMAALSRAHGERVLGLLGQLASVAAALLVDPASLRDAFEGAGLSTADTDRLLGTATGKVPVTRDPSRPGVLDVRLRRP